MRKFFTPAIQALNGDVFVLISNPDCTSYDVQSGFEINSPSVEQAEALQNVFEYFNFTLFDQILPEVYLSVNKHRYKALGYFSPNSWVDSSDPSRVLSEICISPQHLHDPLKDVMSTLVHEMCHLAQYIIRGHLPQSNYHDHDFSKIMQEIGLITSQTGQPGGKPVGRNMSHYIAEGGKFDLAFEQMPQEYLIPLKPKKLEFRNWGHPTINDEQVGTALDSAEMISADYNQLPLVDNPKNKVKFTCPTCGDSAWGKMSLQISCRKCDEAMINC